MRNLMVNSTVFEKYKKRYKKDLLEDVIPFWLKHSGDSQYGGYFSCLSGKGEVYDTDKFVWLQARQVWTFSKFYNEIEKKQEWLEFALSGAEFLEKHGRDAQGNWYFSLNRKGEPLVQPYNIFSDCFACMAFAQLYQATGNDAHRSIAFNTFENILRRADNPKGTYNKSFPGTRDLRNFSLPMILCNLVLEIEHLLDPEMVQGYLKQGVQTVLEDFYDTQNGLIRENINADGSFSDTFQGRLISPGHGLEAMWFLMDIGQRLGDQQVIDKCVEVTLSTLSYGWDKQWGGIYSFLDIKGFPPEQLEWDRKLWWPQIEGMIACLKGFYLTRNEACWDWFVRLEDYTREHFVDKEYGEWYGYLNREGSISLDLKGGKWKGCFHVPRGLFNFWKIMEDLEKVG